MRSYIIIPNFPVWEDHITQLFKLSLKEGLDPS